MTEWINISDWVPCFLYTCSLQKNLWIQNIKCIIHTSYQQTHNEFTRILLNKHNKTKQGNECNLVTPNANWWVMPRYELKIAR